MKQEKTESSITSRAYERLEEDKSYLPIIVKRDDSVARHPDDTLEIAIVEGIEQHEKNSFSLFLSAVAAGLILGFAGMCVALINQAFPSSEDAIFNRLAIAFIYPLGFIICILSGVQLFTEQTATALYPVLDRQAKIKSLLLLWFVVLVGNFAGTFISSILLYQADTVILASEGYKELYHHLLSFETKEVFISSILAGWLMAQGGWLVFATPPSSIQVLCLYIVTFVIGFGGLHHSIAGSAEIFSGLFHADDKHYLETFNFLLTSSFGNLIGGCVFVGFLNYGHIKTSKLVEDE